MKECPSQKSYYERVIKRLVKRKERKPHGISMKDWLKRREFW